MKTRPQVVAELPQFVRDAESAGLSEEERTAIVDVISRDPLRGDEVRGSGGVRKVRFAGRGKGKSGGVTAYFGSDVPVYLVAMLSKGERGNFSATEIAGFKRMTTEIARYWRRRRQ